MGQACSSMFGASKTVEKDPDDMYLDQIEMNETKIDKFDSVFEKASDPLNELVDLNNNMLDAVDNLKEASCIIQGECKVVMKITNHKVTVEIQRMEQDGKEITLTDDEVSQKLKDHPESLAALNNAVHKVNGVLESNTTPKTEWKQIGSRLKITKTGAQNFEIQSLNAAIFTMRKQLMALSHKPGVKGAMECLKETMQEYAKDSMPKVKVEDNGSLGITYGDGEMDVGDIFQNFPPRAKRLKECIDELITCFTEIANALPDLKEKIEALAEEAQNFPSEATDACKEKGLNPMEIQKAVSATTKNVRCLSSAPQMMTQCVETMKSIGTELQEAC